MVRVLVQGPPDTPYDRVFDIQFVIPDTFPMAPPRMRTLTHVWHPNIDLSGAICMSSLDAIGPDSWKSIITLVMLCKQFRVLLLNPNNNSLLNEAAAKQRHDSKSDFECTARRFSDKYCLPMKYLDPNVDVPIEMNVLLDYPSTISADPSNDSDSDSDSE